MTEGRHSQLEMEGAALADRVADSRVMRAEEQVDVGVEERSDNLSGAECPCPCPDRVPGVQCSLAERHRHWPWLWSPKESVRLRGTELVEAAV